MPPSFAPIPSQKHRWLAALLFLILIGIYGYIFRVLLDYDMPWMVQEKFKTHIFILANGKEWHWPDFAKGLNTKVIEIDPNRLSRPLSNMVEVIDAKFRANLWDHVLPHPTFSLQWPFLFIGLPILLYRLFRNLQCHPVIALAGTSLYLTSSGFLSPIVMLSHPAKNMVNFFGILCLSTLTGLYRSQGPGPISVSRVPRFWLVYLGSLISALIVFLSDETGIFLFPVLIVAGFPLLAKFKDKALLLAGFCSLPIIYFLLISLFLPWLHWIVNGETIGLNHYRDYPHITSLFLPNGHNLLTNFYLLFSVHPNLKWHFAPLAGHPVVIALQIIYSLVFLFLAGLFFLAVFKTKTWTFRLKQIAASTSLLLVFVFFHTFQLSHNVRVWTVFWYGCLFSILYYVTLTFVLQFLWEEYQGRFFRLSLPLTVLVLAAHGLMTSTYILAIFKNQGYDPSKFPYPGIYSGEINPYHYFDLSKSLRQSECKYIYTLFTWAQIKHKNIHAQPLAPFLQNCPSIEREDPYFQLDMIYFYIETAFQFPPGYSYLGKTDYVAYLMHQAGEPP